MSRYDERKRPQDDPSLQPGSRALAEYVILLFGALALILVLAMLVVHMLQGLYDQVLGNSPAS